MLWDTKHVRDKRKGVTKCDALKWGVIDSMSRIQANYYKLKNLNDDI